MNHLLRGLIESAWIESLGWVLIHFLWQGAVIGVLGWIGLRTLHKSSAKLRYLLTCILMLVCVAAPVVTFMVRGRSPVTAPGNPKPIMERATVSSAANAEEPPGLISKNATVVPAVPMTESLSSAKIALPPPPVPALLEDKPVLTDKPGPIGNPIPLHPKADEFARWAVPIWLLGIALMALRLGLGWCRIQSWRWSAALVCETALLESFHALAKKFNLHGRVRLLISEKIPGPLTLGCFKPVILLPAQMLIGLPPELLQALIAHELAHVARHDYFVNLLQSTLEIILFYHPAIWWLSAQVRIAREECCDEIAAQVCTDRLVYARALEQLASFRLQAEPAAAASGGSLPARIARVLGRPLRDPVCSARNAAWAFCLLCFAAISGILLLPESRLTAASSPASPSLPIISTQPASAAGQLPAAPPGWHGWVAAGPVIAAEQPPFAPPSSVASVTPQSAPAVLPAPSSPDIEAPTLISNRINTGPLPGGRQSTAQTSSRWIAPFIQVSDGNFNGRQSTTVRWYNSDGTVANEIRDQQVAVLGFVKGFFGTIQNDGLTIYSTSSSLTFKIPATTSASSQNLWQSAAASEDGSTFVYGEPWGYGSGNSTVSVYYNGKPSATLGPFSTADRPLPDICVGPDGSVALMVRKYASGEQRLPSSLANVPHMAPLPSESGHLYVYAPGAKLAFEADCERPLLLESVAPGGRGVLVETLKNDHATIQSEYFAKDGRRPLAGYDPQSIVVNWLPDSSKAIVANDHGKEGNFVLHDFENDATLWQSDPLPKSEHTFMQSGTGAYGTIADGYFLVSTMTDSTDSTRKDRTIYALDADTGRLVATWSSNFYAISLPATFARHNGALYLVTDDEFAPVNTGEIMTEKNGWKLSPSSVAMIEAQHPSVRHPMTIQVPSTLVMGNVSVDPNAITLPPNYPPPGSGFFPVPPIFSGGPKIQASFDKFEPVSLMVTDGMEIRSVRKAYVYPEGKSKTDGQQGGGDSGISSSGRLGGMEDVSLTSVKPGTKYNVEYVLYVVETTPQPRPTQARFDSSGAPGFGPGTTPLKPSTPAPPIVYRPARVLWTSTFDSSFEVPAGMSALDLQIGP